MKRTIVSFVCAVTLLGLSSSSGNDTKCYEVPAAVKGAAAEYAVYIGKLGSVLPRDQQGSGCLISSAGLVLTNWHVVNDTLTKGTRRIKVDWAPLFPIGAHGSIVYAAPELDLALVKLDRAPGKEGIRIAETAGLNDCIYPVGFTEGRHDSPSGKDQRARRRLAQRVRQEIFGSMVRTIDTGFIEKKLTNYSFRAAWQKPDELPLNERAIATLKRADGLRFFKIRLEDILTRDPKSDQWNAFQSNAWSSPGQSGGPCFGEHARLIALSHAGWFEGHTYQIPADLIRLFLVGVLPTGELCRPIIDKFDELGGTDNLADQGKVGLPYDPDGHPFARQWGGGVIQKFRKKNGEECTLYWERASNTVKVLGKKPRGITTTTVFVLDCSGSMSRNTPDSQQKLEAAKKAARHYLDIIEFDNTQLGAKHEVGVASFSGSAYATLPLTADLSQARDAMDSLSPMNSTNFGDALDMAISWFERLSDDRRKGRKFIIFLSDGMTNTGPVERNQFVVSSPDEFANDLRLYQRAVKEGIRIYTVGFGDPSQATGLLGSDEGLDEEVLHRIAEVPGTGGRYFPAADAFELDEVYVRSFHDATGDLVFETTGTISQGETKEVGPFNPATRTGSQSGSTRSALKRLGRIPLLITPAFADAPTDSQMLVTLGWSVGELGIELKDPGGRIVDDSYPGAHVRRGDQPICIAIDSPRIGNWIATITGDNVPGAESRYHLIVSARVPPAPVGGGGVIGGTELDPQMILLICMLGGILVLSILCIGVAIRRRAAPGAMEPVLAWLQVHEANKAPRNIKMTGRVVRIGRATSSDIRLNDPKVSAHHAEVRIERGAAVVSDLGSTNGVRVNGEPIRHRALRSGDRIGLGDTLVIYFLIERRE